MTLYCGIDLHANNHYVAIIDDEDHRLLERRLSNAIDQTLMVLQDYRAAISGIVVESTFNWYWLVDGLQEQGYKVHLANPTAIKQYDGLKYSDDRHDAFYLAHLLRLQILPVGYIYPKEQRGVRDLLRRRMTLVQISARLMIAAQSQLWRCLGLQVSSNQLRRVDYESPFPPGPERLALTHYLRLYHQTQGAIQLLTRQALALMKEHVPYQLLRTMPGIGEVLGLTIALETGDIQRFQSPGNYASYCRCVQSRRMSNGKCKGQGNRKSGNKYLSWAFHEVAHYMVRFELRAKRFYEHKRTRTNGIVGIRAVAHKCARAAYMIMRHETPFDASRLFA